MNKLKEIFQKQLELNLKINPNYEKDIIQSKNPEIKMEWIQNVANAIFAEVSELSNTTEWYKWWKASPEWNEDIIHNIKIELTDILFFLITAFQIMEVDEEEVFKYYLAKWELNMKRQKEGYQDGTYEKIDDNGNEDNYYLRCE